MKIEVGKSYCTRRGKCATITALRGDGSFKGFVGKRPLHWYGDNGRVSSYGCSPWDLIKEWSDKTSALNEDDIKFINGCETAFKMGAIPVEYNRLLTLARKGCKNDKN